MAITTSIRRRTKTPCTFTQRGMPATGLFSVAMSLPPCPTTSKVNSWSFNRQRVQNPAYRTDKAIRASNIGRFVQIDRWESGLEMEKNSTDRRVARTRAGLQHALIALIMKKGYDAITVEDICEEANVGRSTFYLHYASKDALKRSGLEHLRKELVDRQKEAFGNEGAGVSGELRFGLALFEHARDHIELYRALVGSGGESVSLSGIREILCDLVRSDLVTTRGRGSSEAVPMEFVVQYLVGAYMAVLTWWLDKGAKPSPERVDAMFRRLAIEGVTATRRSAGAGR